MEGFKDLRQTRQWAVYLQKIGWIVERVPDFLYIRKIPLLPWSIGKLQRANNVDWARVERIKKKYRVIKLITEETVAKKTIWVDLTKSEKILLGEMKAKTRYNIGLAKRRRIKIKVVNGQQLQRLQEKQELFELIKQNARRLRIFGVPKKWFEAQVGAFGKKCFAVLAYKPRRLNNKTSEVDDLVAGNFFMTSSDTCFYSHNGSTVEGRKNMAPTLCVWEGIREARRRKLEVFDFDGIDDGRFSAWRGFTKFKRGFGGEVVTFPANL